MTSTETAWKQHAKKTAHKINLGWWLQTLASPLLLASLAVACIALFLRRETGDYPATVMSIAASASFTLIALGCFLVARKRFETASESLVRIEAKMKLQNALTAANAGMTSWPNLPNRINSGVQWHWRRLLPPFLGAAFILACGFLIPIAAKDTSSVDQQPHAWSKLDSSLAILENQEIIQEDYIDDTREKLEELRQKAPEEWFSHSSLEATDNLQKNHANNQEQLQRALEQGEQALDALQNQSANMSAAQKQQLMNDFDQALQKMEQGAMKPNTELLNQLKKLDPDQLTQLDQNQLDQLRENMRRGAQGLEQDGQGEGEGEGGGQGEGSQDENKQGDGTGSGGINRGPGHAPNPLGQKHPDTGAGDYQGLQSNDLRNAGLGDLLETSEGEHDIDKTPLQLREGGTTKSKGKGGDRVWKNSLLPNEKKALKNFFQ